MTTDGELQSRLVALTRDLILIPSTEDRPAERHHCFEFLHNHLDSLPGVRVEYFERNGHESMVARPEGIDVPDIMLCGHLDVIEHPQSDCYHSKIADGRIYGPGSGDMKGQDAILHELFCSLHSRHPGISVGLMFTSDEERGGADGVQYLLGEVGLRCGLALVPDGGSLNDVTIEEKGVLHARLRMTGHEAHGARPWLGQNAVERLMDRLVALRQHFDSFWPTAPIEEQVNHWFPTCSLTIFGTPNTTPNRIPDRAEAVIDIRFPPPQTLAELRATVEDILGLECELEPLMTAEPTHLAPDPLFSEITAELTGHPVRHVKASGGSDGRFFRLYDIPVNLSRPLVGNLHAIDEWIDIASMVTYYRICERYVLRKFGLAEA
ncbi:MAG: M20 family metallopeptidase [Planctomycetota bacterium]|jgi:succinyl-diaminopimelate desuccinylase